ncbi:MAG: 2-keto-3-deoxy-D-arabino-heptulosonate-7-phosphate synthase I beta, partial [uncultured Thermomicrobiales bacterium]
AEGAGRAGGRGGRADRRGPPHPRPGQVRRQPDHHAGPTGNDRPLRAGSSRGAGGCRRLRGRPGRTTGGAGSERL